MPGIDAPSAPKLSSRLLPLALWIIIAVVGFFLLDRYLGQKEEEARAGWYKQLSLVAQLQAQQVDDWLGTRRATIVSVSDNMSARMYLQTLLARKNGGEKPASAPEGLPELAMIADAEQTFLQNYLLSMAQQGGFTQQPQETDQIRANVPQDPVAGLSLIDTQGNAMVMTGAMPPVAPLYEQFAGMEPKQGVGIGFPVVLTGGRSVLPFIAPMMPVQPEPDSKPLGYVLGAVPVDTGLFALVQRPLDQHAAAVSQLAMNNSNGATLLQPGGKDGEMAVPIRDKGLVEARALKQPGILHQGRGVEGEALLAVAASAGAGPWMVLRTIPVTVALGALNQQALGLTASFLLGLLVVTLAVALLWRHLNAQQTERLMTDIRAHRALLQLVTDRLPARLFIVDGEERYAYANAKAAQEADMAAEAMHGKNLDAVLGRERAQPYRDEARKALHTGTSSATWHEWTDNGRLYAREIEAVPLETLPGHGGRKIPHALVVEQDFSDMVRARHAQQQSLDKLLETLVMLVDRRDPTASRQSTGVAMISRRVAQAMGLDATEAETAHIAGRLRNLNKLMIPQEVLTSGKPLDDEDKKLFDESFDALVSHLKDVPFNGPVVETLLQSRERVDGTGPKGLDGEQLLPSAKAVAVANAFVALTSTRAHREGLSIDAALEELRRDAGKAYAKSAVAALAHYLENQEGRGEWDGWQRG